MTLKNNLSEEVSQAMFSLKGFTKWHLYMVPFSPHFGWFSASGMTYQII